MSIRRVPPVVTGIRGLLLKRSTRRVHATSNPRSRAGAGSSARAFARGGVARSLTRSDARTPAFAPTPSTRVPSASHELSGRHGARNVHSTTQGAYKPWSSAPERPEVSGL
jgi:hypothetical protein